MIFVQILYINLFYEIHSLIDSFLYFFLKRMYYVHEYVFLQMNIFLS